MARILKPLEGRSAPLFLIAGVLLLVFAGLNGVEAATDSAPPDIFGPLGYAVAFVALLGLYPTLVNHSRWSARAGAIAAIVGVLGWAALTVLGVLTAVGVLPPPEELGPAGFAALAPAGLGMVLGYLLFSVATLRSRVYSRTVGVLMLAPPVIFVAVFAVLAPVFGDLEWGPFVAGAAQALVHLALGFTLRKESRVGGAPDRRDQRAPAAPR